MSLRFVVFFIFSFSYYCIAQTPYEGTGTRSNLFLKLDVSPRVSGMGSVFTGIANDENSLLYNTAGLAKPLMSGVSLNHTQWFEDIRIENLLFLYKLGYDLGMGIGISYLGMPVIHGMSDDGQPTNDDINVSSSVIQLGVGYEVYNNILLGVGLKYFNDNLAGISGTGVALDAGLLFETIFRGLNFGVSVQNVGGNYKYDFFNEKIPMNVRTGVAYKIPGQDLRFGLDLVKSVDQDYQVNLGGEYVIEKYVVIRLGNQAISGQLLSPTFGLGVNVEDKYLIDYTFANHETLGSTHRAGITFRFNLPPVMKKHGSGYNFQTARVVMAPRGLRYEIINNKMVIKWLAIPKGKYNVYAKSDKNDPWKKLNNKPLFSTEMDFKQPTAGKKYYITVTTILDNVESAFENEIEIEVK